MATSTVEFGNINGFIDTSSSVLENLDILATSCGAFVTWDPVEGLWSAVVNEAGVTTKSFNDTNIIGGINISATALDQLYNSATIQFPHEDLRDAIDIITVSIPSADRNPQELDNVLNIKLETVNNPVQAQYIATRELKQARVDKLITFVTDFTGNGVKAGDIIDITTSVYGYTNKYFRVMTVEETDSDAGELLFEITALEYDADVYSTAGLERTTRTKRTGVIPKIINEELEKDDDSLFGSILNKIINAGLDRAKGLIVNELEVDEEDGTITQNGTFVDEPKNELISSIARPPCAVSANASQVCTGSTITFSVSTNCSSCYFDNPTFTYEYEITGVGASDVNIPLTGTLQLTGNSITNIPVTVNIPGSVVDTITFTVQGLSASVDIYPIPTQYIDSVSSNVGTVEEGGSFTITVDTTGYSDGDTLDYEITGATARVSTATTGTVSITSNQATLTVDTIDDTVPGVNESITVAFDDGITVDPCAITGTNFVTLNILENDIGATMSSAFSLSVTQIDGATTDCIYVEVPLVWCGKYETGSNELVDAVPLKTVLLPVPRSSEVTVSVPTAISVSQGNPSTITVVETVEVADNTNPVGGIHFEIITNFDDIYPDKLITGVTSTVYGYF